MNVYLAAKYSRREEMEKLAADLPSVGMECVARWVYGGEEGLTRPEIATLDLNDVTRADVCIVFTHPRGEPQPGGGRFVEFGYAMALGNRCIVIGPIENVFCETPGVERYDDWKSFLEIEAVSNRESQKRASARLGGKAERFDVV